MLTIKTPLLLLMILGLAVACNKQADEATPTDIKGTWELSRVDGEMLNTDLAPGNGNLLKFTDSTYETHVNGQLARSGKYRIVIDSAGPPPCIVVPKGGFLQRIIYDGNYTEPGSFFQIEKGKLRIASCRPGWADASSMSTYIKIADASN
jgi:hypothetical protein